MATDPSLNSHPSAWRACSLLRRPLREFSAHGSGTESPSYGGASSVPRGRRAAGRALQRGDGGRGRGGVSALPLQPRIESRTRITKQGNRLLRWPHLLPESEPGSMLQASRPFLAPILDARIEAIRIRSQVVGQPLGLMTQVTARPLGFTRLGYVHVPLRSGDVAKEFRLDPCFHPCLSWTTSCAKASLVSGGNHRPVRRGVSQRRLPKALCGLGQTSTPRVAPPSGAVLTMRCVGDRAECPL